LTTIEFIHRIAAATACRLKLLHLNLYPQMLHFIRFRYGLSQIATEQLLVILVARIERDEHLLLRHAYQAYAVLVVVGHEQDHIHALQREAAPVRVQRLALLFREHLGNDEDVVEEEALALVRVALFLLCQVENLVQLNKTDQAPVRQREKCGRLFGTN